MEQLRPYVASGRLQLAVVPVSVLDPEDGGRSTLLAKAMLSLRRDTMVAAWNGHNLTNEAEPAADMRLAANQAAARTIGLRGTPTILWRRVDGTEGRADGLPGNLDALVASIGGAP
jgi:thiol:disulfide interchange protein DsbG